MLLGALLLDGTTACVAIEGATDTEVFRECRHEILVHMLRPNDVVLMDNLLPLKSAETLRLITNIGGKVRFLPAHSPDLNPIEKMSSEVKNAL